MNQSSPINKNADGVFLEWLRRLDVRAAAEGTMEAWEDIAPSLPRETRDIAQDFVDLCRNCGAFESDPPCNVDALDDGQVMFDWNNGEPPVFTVLIDYGPSIVCVGRFGDKKVVEEFDELRSAYYHLQNFLGTIKPKNTWNTNVSLDSLLRGRSGSEKASPLSTLQLKRQEHFPYFPVTERPTYCEQVNMWLRSLENPYTAGRGWKSVHTPNLTSPLSPMLTAFRSARAGTWT